MTVVQAPVVPFAQTLAGRPSRDTEGLWARRGIHLELTLRLAMMFSRAKYRLQSRQDDERQAHHRSRKTSPCDPHQGLGSRTRRTHDVSNKTTQILTINPDLRTVAASNSAHRPSTIIQTVHSHLASRWRKSHKPHHHLPGPAFSPQYATLRCGQEWNWLGSWTGRRGVHLASGCFAHTKRGGDIYALCVTSGAQDGYSRGLVNLASRPKTAAVQGLVGDNEAASCKSLGAARNELWLLNTCLGIRGRDQRHGIL
jgi:hypothetical protein